MDRFEYQQRAVELAKRGLDLPQTKILPLEVIAIRAAARRREELRKEINDTLSNAALAKKYGVHERTIEKVLAYKTHIQIM